MVMVSSRGLYSCSSDFPPDDVDTVLSLFFTMLILMLFKNERFYNKAVYYNFIDKYVINILKFVR